jgi:hypothetical protein
MDHQDARAPSTAVWDAAPVGAVASDAPLASTTAVAAPGGAPARAGALFDGLYGVCREAPAPALAAPSPAPNLFPDAGQPSYVPGQPLVTPLPPEVGMRERMSREHPILAPLIENVLVPSAKSTGEAFMGERADRSAVAERGVARATHDKMAADQAKLEEGRSAQAHAAEDSRRPVQPVPAKKPVGPLDLLFDFVKADNQRR